MSYDIITIFASVMCGHVRNASEVLDTIVRIRKVSIKYRTFKLGLTIGAWSTIAISISAINLQSINILDNESFNLFD